MALLYRVRGVIDGWQGGPGLFTAYFDAAAPPTSTEAATVAARVRAAWDVWKSTMANATTFQVQGAVDVIDDTNGELDSSFFVTPPAVVNSTSINGPGPAEVAAGLILDTGVITDGRRLRGRYFMTPLPGSLTSSLLPPAGLVTNLNAFGVALIGSTPPMATAPLVVWRRPKKDASGTIIRLGSSAPVLSATAAPKYWTLRSRRD